MKRPKTSTGRINPMSLALLFTRRVLITPTALRHGSGREELKNLIREHLLEILQASERAPARVAEPPAVVLVVGVNGSGKTTTIGKLASRFKHEQRSVLL